jgi:cobalt-zinc-cadmium efflux system outer membrane protein
VPLIGGGAAPERRAGPLPVFMLGPAHTVSDKAEAVEPTAAAGPPPTPSTTAGPRTFTLDQAIRRALEADPQIPAGLEDIRQSEADLVTAGLLPNPELYGDLLMMPWGKPFSPERQGAPPDRLLLRQPARISRRIFNRLEEIGFVPIDRDAAVRQIRVVIGFNGPMR